MSYYEEDYSTGMARDRKQRKKDYPILRKFFKKHKGKPVEQAYAYNKLVSLYNDKDTVCHWAFYEWIDKQITEGNMKKEPIYRTRIVGYKLTYKGR